MLETGARSSPLRFVKSPGATDLTGSGFCVWVPLLPGLKIGVTGGLWGEVETTADAELVRRKQSLLLSVVAEVMGTEAGDVGLMLPKVQGGVISDLPRKFPIQILQTILRPLKGW